MLRSRPSEEHRRFLNALATVAMLLPLVALGDILYPSLEGGFVTCFGESVALWLRIFALVCSVGITLLAFWPMSSIWDRLLCCVLIGAYCAIYGIGILAILSG